MSKKRKKHYQPGMQKVLQAQHRNDYFKRLGIFLKDLTGEDVLALIPSEERERLYIKSTLPIIAEPCAGHDVPPELINAIKETVNWLFKKYPIPVEKTNQNVYLGQYYTFGVALYSYVEHLNDVNYKSSDKVKDLLENHFGNLLKIDKMIKKEIFDRVYPYLSAIANNFCYGFYSFSLILKEEGLRQRFVIRVKKYPPEKIRITLNNNSRMAYRVGFALFDHFEWSKVTPTELGINSAPDNHPIPVYIQKHTWHRLIERLDCLPQQCYTISIFSSLSHCNVVRDRGNFLIDFYAGDTKAGYLVAVLIDNKLIIRTFLFLTCSGTPEGKRLEELAGLQKLDTKYLKMDKLSTFMSAKISSNEEVKSIFRKADCLHLLELFDNLDKYSRVHPDHSPLESISSYLKTNDVKLMEWEEEEEENIDNTNGRHHPGPSPGEGIRSSV